MNRLIAAILFILNSHAVYSESLCKTGEKSFFACQTNKNKAISLCGDGSALQYRFGKPEKIELAYPDNSSVGYQKFTYFHYFRPRVDRTEIRFNNKGVDYILFEYLDGESERKYQQYRGVTVLIDGKEFAIHCTGRHESSLYELQDKLPNDDQWQD